MPFCVLFLFPLCLCLAKSYIKLSTEQIKRSYSFSVGGKCSLIRAIFQLKEHQCAAKSAATVNGNFDG